MFSLRYIYDFFFFFFFGHESAFVILQSKASTLSGYSKMSRYNFIWTLFNTGAWNLTEFIKQKRTNEYQALEPFRIFETNDGLFNDDSQCLSCAKIYDSHYSFSYQWGIMQAMVNDPYGE